MRIDAHYILNEAKIVEDKIQYIPEQMKIEVEANDIINIPAAYNKDTLLGKENFKTLILKSYRDIDIDDNYIIDDEFREENNLHPVYIEEECSFSIKYTRVNYFLQVDISEGKYGYIANYPTLSLEGRTSKLLTPAYQLAKLIKYTITELGLENYTLETKDGFMTIRGVSTTAGNVSIKVNLKFPKFVEGGVKNEAEKTYALMHQLNKLTKTMRRHSDKTRLRLYKTITPKVFGALLEQDYLDNLNPSLRYNIIMAINDCASLLLKTIPNADDKDVEALPKILEIVANHKEIATKDKTKTLFKILILAWYNFWTSCKLKQCYLKGETLDKDVYSSNAAIISVKDIFSLSIVENPIVKSLVVVNGIKESVKGLRLLQSIVAVGAHNDIKETENTKYNIVLAYEKKSEIAAIALKELIDIFSAMNPGESDGQNISNQ